MGEDKNIDSSIMDSKIGDTVNLDSYQLTVRSVPIRIEIMKQSSQTMPTYNISYPVIPFVNSSMEAEIKVRLIRQFTPAMLKYNTIEEYRAIEEKFESTTFRILDELIPNMTARDKKLVSVNLLMQMLGLSRLDIMLQDDALEEICINHSNAQCMVYHKKFGWLRTNFFIKTEKEVYDLAEKMASKYGKELNVAKPILDDAILVTGDRATATLFPISTKGNTITIRKFRRDPWTIVDLIKSKTMSADLAALLWECVQYELNVLVVGGTASGKTSLLNALLLFIPPTQRIISIEDVRELNLPEHLHWVPMASRISGGEKAEKITMLRLMIAALRMRPDRMVLGEVRTSEEAQTLFEAADTGHSTYSTLHANRIDGMFRRLLNPPIEVPENMLSSLHLALVQYRQKRQGFRRTIEVAEIIPPSENKGITSNMLYKWNARSDTLEKVGKSTRVMEELQFFSGLSEEEIEKDIEEKVDILNWMVKNNIRSIEEVGKVFQKYYENKGDVLEMIKRVPNENNASLSY